MTHDDDDDADVSSSVGGTTAAAIAAGDGFSGLAVGDDVAEERAPIVVVDNTNAQRATVGWYERQAQAAGYEVVVVELVPPMHSRGGGGGGGAGAGAGAGTVAGAAAGCGAGVAVNMSALRRRGRHDVPIKAIVQMIHRWEAVDAAVFVASLDAEAETDHSIGGGGDGSE
jgi:hypothetical protein